MDVNTDQYTQNSNVDVLVIGAGFAGLVSAFKISRLGYSVTVVDQAGYVGTGASTKNEGWLHAGTYHAASISEPQEACAVARRCMAGFRWTRSYAPEAIEDDLPAYAIVKDVHLDQMRDRWDEAGVRFALVTNRHLARMSDQIFVSADERVLQVQDVAVNTRLLIARYLCDLRRTEHVSILLGVQMKELRSDHIDVLRRDGSCHQVKFKVLLLTAGYGSHRLLSLLGLEDPGIRHWRSHLLFTGRLCDFSVFSVHEGEAAMVNHGRSSVVGLNNDAAIVRQPSFELDPRKAQLLKKATQRRFRRFTPATPALITACTKVDMVASSDLARSLNISIAELRPNVYAVLPGKMTEAPYMADQLVKLVFSLLDRKDIAYRPLDSFLEDRSG